jgi:hypothetical protein
VLCVCVCVFVCVYLYVSIASQLHGNTWDYCNKNGTYPCHCNDNQKSIVLHCDGANNAKKLDSVKIIGQAKGPMTVYLAKLTTLKTLSLTGYQTNQVRLNIAVFV